MHNWPDIACLQTGTPRQRQAHAVLLSLNLPTALNDFDPVLAGTVPLAIDVAGSHLDLSYEVPATALLQVRPLLCLSLGSWSSLGWMVSPPLT
jgi:hypothetical protein